jgi:GT2 family glycosyltransferase
MREILNSYLTKKGEELVYNGSPDLNQLEKLAEGNGDAWHSSFDQGYKNALEEVVYQSHILWWFVNDFDNLNHSISWRINPNAFVMRKSVWIKLGGFDPVYSSKDMQGLALGYDLIRNGGIPYYVKGLFSKSDKQFEGFTKKDLYAFFRKKFRFEHSLYLLFRKGFFKPIHWISFVQSKNLLMDKPYFIIKDNELLPLSEIPKVSFIIPTMLRQEMTYNLLKDLNNQTVLPKEVIVVDATPEMSRELHWYNSSEFQFQLIVKWQTSKGSCRARNEGIELSSGDYVIFSDDDIRIPPNYIENHIRFLETYKVEGAVGMDIQADNSNQQLEDLYTKIDKLPQDRLTVKVTSNFNNANSCVKKDWVSKIGGNDINYDGGYGEDADFGLSLFKIGATILYNPYSANLHLKPPSGGYRWWGAQSSIMGKKRKKQPWELNSPVKYIRPLPSPTVMYKVVKHFSDKARLEYKIKYFMAYLLNGKIFFFPFRLFNIPYKLLQFNRSKFYANNLLKLGVRIK